MFAHLALSEPCLVLLFPSLFLYLFSFSVPMFRSFRWFSLCSLSGSSARRPQTPVRLAFSLVFFLPGLGEHPELRHGVRLYHKALPRPPLCFFGIIFLLSPVISRVGRFSAAFSPWGFWVGGRGWEFLTFALAAVFLLLAPRATEWFHACTGPAPYCLLSIPVLHRPPPVGRLRCGGKDVRVTGRF